MRRKIIVAVSFLLLCTMSFPMFSCKKEDPAVIETQVTNNETMRDDLPQTLNFNKKTVNMLSREFDWYYNEITLLAEEAQTLVDQAVYKRELTVEERLGVNLENQKIAGAGKEGFTVVTEALRNDILAEAREYDIIVNNMYHTMGLATEGLFYDLNTVEYVDTSKEYYSQNFVDKSTIGDSLYSVTGDAALTFIKFALVTYFNKSVAKDNNIDNLYQTVIDGKWTYDYQYQLVKNLYVDKNGDLISNDGDIYGLVTNSVTAVDPYWSAFDLSIIKRDSNGDFTSDISSEKITDALGKINDLYWRSKGTYVLSHKANDTELEEASKMFAENQTLFTVLRLNACESAYLRDMKSDYGIIPMPKYDEAQNQYYSYCHDLFSVFCISSGVSDDRVDMIGATLECFFSESEDCRYSLFDVALKVKYQSDEDSGKMLDIIIDNVKIDSGWIYSKTFGDFALCMRTLVQAKSSSFPTYWKMNESMLNKKIDDFNIQSNK